MKISNLMAAGLALATGIGLMGEAAPSNAATCTLSGTPFFTVGEISGTGPNCTGATKRANALGLASSGPRLRVNNFKAISAQGSGLKSNGLVDCTTPADTTQGFSPVQVQCSAQAVTHTVTATF
jgi:hypothetical protein